MLGQDNFWRKMRHEVNLLWLFIDIRLPNYRLTFILNTFLFRPTRPLFQTPCTFITDLQREQTVLLHKHVRRNEIQLDAVRECSVFATISKPDRLSMRSKYTFCNSGYFVDKHKDQIIDGGMERLLLLLLILLLLFNSRYRPTYFSIQYGRFIRTKNCWCGIAVNSPRG